MNICLLTQWKRKRQLHEWTRKLSVAIRTKKKSRDHEKYRKGVGRDEEGEDLGCAAVTRVSDAEGIQRTDGH